MGTIALFFWARKKIDSLGARGQKALNPEAPDPKALNP